METRLSKVEAVLLFDEEDLEAQTGIKREDDLDIEEETSSTKVANSVTLATGSTDSSHRRDEDEDKFQVLMQTELEKMEQDLLSVDEDWRDLYKEAMTYPDQLK